MYKFTVKASMFFAIFFAIFSVKTAKALTLENDTVTTSSGYTMTEEQYNQLSEKYSDPIIDNTSIEDLKILTSEDTVLLNSEKKYIVTDYIIDINGNVLSATDVEVDEETATQNSTQDTLSTNGNSGNTYHATSSKVIVIDSYYTGSEYFTTLTADWYTTPNIKSYDVMAIRWTNSSIGVTSATGIQVYGSSAVVNYSYNGSNMVNKSNGIGISMNLVDSGSDYSLALYIHSSKSGGTYYGTYQHAITNVTLAQSQSYSFSSSGLGGVLLYSSSTISSYYDNMQGVKISA